MSLSPAQLDRLARKRAGAKLGWFIHATVFALVNLGLFAIATVNGKHWHLFPLLGWGLGLAIHGTAVWLIPTGGRFHQAMVERERQRLQGL